MWKLYIFKFKRVLENFKHSVIILFIIKIKVQYKSYILIISYNLKIISI